MIIDFHTHTFPDKMASAVIGKLQAASHTRAFTDGTVSGLKASMARAGIDVSIVMPVATNPRQVEHVNDASVALNREGALTGVYSFGCMHPDHPDPERELERIAAQGVRGIKLHPVYQGVDFDDERYIRILKRCRELKLIVLIHAGFDIGFPGVEHASPAMIRRAAEQVGGLKLVLAHMGSWRCWQNAADTLKGLGLYIDTSFSIGKLTSNGDGCLKSGEEELMTPAEAAGVLRRYGADRALFGSDSPWGSQAETVRAVKALGLTEAEERMVFSENAKRLLEI